MPGVAGAHSHRPAPERPAAASPSTGPSATGRPRRVRLVWTLNRDSHGAPTSLNVFCLDEARPSAGERFWEALLTESADITWTADPDGVLTTATAGAVQQTGRSAEGAGGDTTAGPRPPGRPGGAARGMEPSAQGHRPRGRGVPARPSHPRLAARPAGADRPPRQPRRRRHRRQRGRRPTSCGAWRRHSARRRCSGGPGSRVSPVPQVQWDAAGRVTDANTAFCDLVVVPRRTGRPAGSGLPAPLGARVRRRVRRTAATWQCRCFPTRS